MILTGKLKLLPRSPDKSGDQVVVKGNLTYVTHVRSIVADDYWELYNEVLIKNNQTYKLFIAYNDLLLKVKWSQWVAILHRTDLDNEPMVEFEIITTPTITYARVITATNRYSFKNIMDAYNAGFYDAKSNIIRQNEKELRKKFSQD